MIKSSIENDNDFNFLERIYTHGTLEEEVGYDLICCDEALFSRIKEFKESKEDTLVRFENFQINKDYEKSVVMYIWKGKETDYTMGLVVNHDDIESVQYASEKMKLRVDCI